MDSLFYSVALVVGTFWLIRKGYEYYKLTWPERYFGPEDKANLFISTSPLYYSTFRLLPVFVSILVTHGVFYKASIAVHDPIHIYHPAVLGFITAFLYAFVTDGKVILLLAVKSSNVEIFINKVLQYFLHLSALIILPLIGVGAGYAAMNKEVLRFLPELYGLVDNIWAAFFTIILFFAAKGVINKPKEVNIDEAIKKSAAKISTEIYSLIESLSRKHKADEVLVKAICIAENIERAKWVRRLENVVGLFRRSGTYGIMQVQSPKPISDEESVKQAIEKHFTGTENMDFPQKMKTVESYNSNNKYISLVEAIYNFITPTP